MLHVAMRPPSSSGSMTARTPGRVSRRVSALLSARYSAMRRSTPGAGHHVGIIELQAVASEEKIDELAPTLKSDDLIERGIDGVRESGGAQQLLGPVDLGEVNLERGLAALGLHRHRIAT